MRLCDVDSAVVMSHRDCRGRSKGVYHREICSSGNERARARERERERKRENNTEGTARNNNTPRHCTEEHNVTDTRTQRTRTR
eukprot:COSAG02_NODE_33764_length_494_cov_3395.736709_1_plen_82_part_10